MSKRRKISAALPTGILIAAAFLATACGGSKNANNANSTANAPAASPVQVTTARAVARDVPSFIQTTGSLVAEEESEIAPQVSGQVVDTPVGVGAFVNQGDVIARLDASDAQLRFQQAQSNEQQAQSNVRQAELRVGLAPGQQFDPEKVPEVIAARRNTEAAQAQIRNAEAQIASADAAARLAEDTARRYLNLVNSGDISRVAYNQQQTQAETARAQLNSAREQVSTVRAQATATGQQADVVINTARQNNQAITAARGNLENTRAATALAQKAVNDTVVRAPFAGSISDRPVAVGEYVTPASRLATLVRTNPIKVQIQLPEADAGRVSVGQQISINVQAFADRQFAGQITNINPSLDATTRSVVVEAQLENPENLLRPNMFATVRIQQPGGTRSVFVPTSAILRDPTTNTASVYVLDSNTARSRQVQIGMEEGDSIQIVTGVDENETVATSNIEQLFDGATVTF